MEFPTEPEKTVTVGLLETATKQAKVTLRVVSYVLNVNCGTKDDKTLDLH